MKSTCSITQLLSECRDFPAVIGLLNFNVAQVKSMDDNCGEWVECMGVARGCGYQEVGVASGSGWNLWVWLVGGMYGCGYQEVGVVGRRRVWLAGGMYECGYQEVGVVSRRRVWLAGGMYGCGYQEVGVVGIYWCG